VKEPSISEVENAFLPAKEILYADRFAGRKNAVEEAYLGLISAGSNLAIVGNRGIGKTSLARQLINIAKGKQELLEKLQIAHDHKLDFLCFYLTCGNAVSTIDDLLLQLLTSQKCLADWVYDLPRSCKEIEKLSPQFGANIFGLQATLGGERTTETTSGAVLPEHPISSIFTNVLTELCEQKLAKDGVLIVIDEFDQIINPLGFAHC
jgi:Cdc6-like AAA superfamily ATPase